MKVHLNNWGYREMSIVYTEKRNIENIIQNLCLGSNALQGQLKL
jgi:hypothetical protein